ncbi:MAG TPA: superoxide dismutase family protein [Ignavibacteriaceae bacterium]|nr:superoxide dismutase family protein [Ignavibacteriaceae bacterium]
MFKLFFLAAAALFIFNGDHQPKKQNAGTNLTVINVTRAYADLKPTKGNNVKGKVTFTKQRNGIKVTADVEGLKPGKHGFHIHETGDCSAPDGSSAGGHFNPGHMNHGAPTDSVRHAGDLGNLEAGKNGKAHLEWIDTMISFEGMNSIIGKAVIVHEKVDDYKTQPTGNAGARLACGVIKSK